MDTIIDTRTISMPYMHGSTMGGCSAQLSALKLATNASARPQNDPLDTAASVWTKIQSRALVSLTRAVEDSSVFAALVGPAGSGTTDVLSKLLAQSKTGNRICISIQDPNKISVEDVAEIDQALVKATDGIKNRSVHLLIGVHDAHAATPELLEMLNRFAQSTSRVLAPQIILAGESELWNNLEAPRFKILRQRFALRLKL